MFCYNSNLKLQNSYNLNDPWVGMVVETLWIPICYSLDLKLHELL
jgi:hypothetical protein